MTARHLISGLQYIPTIRLLESTLFILNNQLTNSHHSTGLPCEVHNYSVGQEILSPLVDPILGPQLIPVHILKFGFSEIHFDIVILSVIYLERFLPQHLVLKHPNL
jgi:hypothetical protein